MTTENLPSGGTLRAFRRVVMVDGVVVLAGEVPAMGHVTCEGISYGDGQPVHLREPGGAALVEIVGECKDGDRLYAAADGKVSAKGKIQEGVAVGESESGFAQVKWEAKAAKNLSPDAT